MPDVPLKEESAGVLQTPILTAIPWLRHGFSTRPGGISTASNYPNDLNLGLTPADNPASVQENRRRLLQAIVAPSAPDSWALITARQTHSTHTQTITTIPAPPIEADGLITALPSVALAILTADCVPILLADTRQRIVAALHAGWRGTVARIVERGIQLLRNQHACQPEDLLAAIGPSIGPCCYQVGEEVRTAFHEAFDYAPALFRGDLLDLWQANRRQLLDAGLPSANIAIENLCTASTFTPTGQRLFFSHRAEHGHTGRMMSIIGIAPNLVRDRIP